MRENTDKKNSKYGHFLRSNFVPVKYEIQLNPFHATDLFLYLLKRPENQTFSDVFREYEKRPVARNGLKPSQIEISLSNFE